MSSWWVFLESRETREWVFASQVVDVHVISPLQKVWFLWTYSPQIPLEPKTWWLSIMRKRKGPTPNLQPILFGFSEKQQSWDVRLGVCHTPATVGKNSIHFYEGNPINLHCFRVLTSGQYGESLKKSTVTMFNLFRQDPMYDCLDDSFFLMHFLSLYSLWWCPDSESRRQGRCLHGSGATDVVHCYLSNKTFGAPDSLP